MPDSDDMPSSADRIAIDTENLSTPTCHSCSRTEDKQTVLETIRMVGAYDEDTGEYVGGESAVEGGWELIVSAECDITETGNSVRVIPDEFFVFCPDCPADPSVATK